VSAPENDAVEAARLASADNHRLVSIVEAADTLAKAIEAFLRGSSYRTSGVKAALDAFKIARQGS
jgi:hypothetical protein